MKVKTELYLATAALLILFIAGCSNDNKGANGNAVTQTNDPKNIVVDKIEIFHFHGTYQCYSCITVGQYAEDTVNTYFADEVKDGKVIFAHINGELPENSEKVMQYGATGSSLWLGTYAKDGQFKAEQNINVWYKINNKQEYMNYLKGVIEQKLSGG